jgi:hypothetical protein
MTYCGSKPGTCAGKTECGDHLCPGHPFMSGITLASDSGDLIETPDSAESKAYAVASVGILIFVLALGALAHYFA